MDLLSRIFLVANDPVLSDANKIARIKSILAEAAAVPTTGIIERLVLALKTEAGFAYVSPNLTSANCPTVVEPSLDGARLEDKIVGSRTYVLAELKQIGRRSATVAEGELYGLKHPEELSATSWIWCLDQVVVYDGGEYVFVLYVGSDGRRASLRLLSSAVGVGNRVLSFPL